MRNDSALGSEHRHRSAIDLSVENYHGVTFLMKRHASPPTPVSIAVTEEMCANVAAAKTESANAEESKQDAAAADEDSMTCRICLSGYKVSLAPLSRLQSMSSCLSCSDWLPRV